MRGESMKYCSDCGSEGEFTVPEGDNRPRFVCGGCERIHYSNPRIVTGCIPVWEDKVLLCLRAIEPQRGFWTIPGGFMENHEQAEEGAIRETLEEACARVTLTGLQSVYSIPHISQVYLVFTGEVEGGEFAVGAESLEVKLFGLDEIPWEKLAFSAVRFALEKYVEFVGTDNKETHLGSYVNPEGL